LALAGRHACRRHAAAGFTGLRAFQASTAAMPAMMVA
jgi:hypothetical protein